MAKTAPEVIARMNLKQFGPEIPAAPFATWLQEQIAQLEYGSYTDHDIRDRALGDRLGVDQRTIYRYKNSLDSYGKPTTIFRRYKVEDMLHLAGVPFERLYPDLPVVDPPLEEPGFCERCEEVTSRIDGECPWHEPWRRRRGGSPRSPFRPKASRPAPPQPWEPKPSRALLSRANSLDSGMTMR